MAANLLFDLKKDLITLCQDIASFIQEEINHVTNEDVFSKDMNSLVSYVDKEAEKRIVEKLKAILPEAGFITEENTVVREDKPYTWIIDPLDGTTNFLYKIPHFSTSIALMKDDEIVLGIVYEIMQNRSFTAIKGFGAWENETPMRVKPIQNLLEAMVVTGFPNKRDLNLESNLAILKFCILNCRGVRRLGSAALDLAYVASGKIDIYYERDLNIWDIAAGVLLVTEAGGKMSDYNQGNDFLNSGNVIAANHFLHPKIEGAIHDHLD